MLIESFLAPFRVNQPLTADELAFLDASAEIQDELAAAGVTVRDHPDGPRLALARTGEGIHELIETLVAQAEALEEDDNAEDVSLGVGAMQLALRLDVVCPSDAERTPFLLDLKGRL